MARREQLPDGEHVGTRHLTTPPEAQWSDDRSKAAGPSPDDTPCCPDGQPRKDKR